jgi:hypothetical protein
VLAFVATVKDTIKDLHATVSKDASKAKLDEADVLGLRQAVEVLSLINEAR